MYSTTHDGLDKRGVIDGGLPKGHRVRVIHGFEVCSKAMSATVASGEDGGKLLTVGGKLFTTL